VHEKRINAERIDAMKEQVELMLEKKFGRHVSVPKLESLIVNPHMVELRQDQQDFALACGQELHDWNVRPSSFFSILINFIHQKISIAAYFF